MHVFRACHRAQNRGLLTFEFQTFTDKVARAAVGKLHNHGGFGFGCRFDHRVNRVRIDHIHRWQCKTALFTQRKYLLHIIT